MGIFGKSTTKQTAKVKSLIKVAAARLGPARRPRLGRRSIARSDVGQLLAIGHLDRALLRAEQVIDEDNMLLVLDIVELYCKVIIEQAAQLDNPKECNEEVKAAVAGLMFASARLGELPELLDARGIFADKFGGDFARAAKEGSHGVVDATLVRKLSGQRASEEEKRRLAKEVAAENDILLDFHDKPIAQIHQQQAPQVQRKQSVEPIKNAAAPVNKFVEQREVKPARHEQQVPVLQRNQSQPVKNAAAPVKESVEQREVKAARNEVQGRQRFVDESARPGLAQLSMDDKVTRESKKYLDARMAAEAAFESATFAAMAARAAVELSRSQQGKGSRGGGFDKVHPHPAEMSPSWSGGSSTVTSVGSEKGKGVAVGEEEEEEVVWPPEPQPQCRPAAHQRAASVMGTGGGAWHGEARTNGAAPGGNPTHRRHATELAAGDARAHGIQNAQRGGQYVTPPYRRTQTSTAAAAAYESSAHVNPPPYARVVSALERGKNEHIARHEDVRPMGTDARAVQERVYGAAPAGPARGHAVPLDSERRANSVRTRW